MYNTTNSSGQDSILTLRVKGSSAGDPFLSFDSENEAGWAFGMDNSDSNKMKLSTSWSSVSTNTKLTIDTSGKVGIGTTSPGYMLDVNGDINMSTGSSFRINGVAQTFGGSGSGFTGDIADYITHTGDTDTKFGFPSVDKFIVNTAGSERLTILNNGNIGINQTNPQYKLDVDGDINLTGGSGGSSPWATSGNDVYRASGKVGIGKTNPTYAVDVNGTVNATSYLGDGSNLTGVTASAITSEASRTITISTIKAQGGIWDVR